MHIRLQLLLAQKKWPKNSTREWSISTLLAEILFPVPFGRAVLKVVEEEGLQENALKVGGFLIDELKMLQKQFPIIGDVRGEGLFLGFELNDSEKNPLSKHASYLANRMKQLGILMSIDGPDHNVLKIKPPMVFSKENAEELIFRLKTVFGEDFMIFN